MKNVFIFSVFGASFWATGYAQYFQRLGTCPTLGCIFPPDQSDFAIGQYFDIRLEVHAPVNGTEPYNNGVPDQEFTFCIQKGRGECKTVQQFFGGNVNATGIETWSFSYFEDLFAKDTGQLTGVNVAARSYRALRLTKAGDYTARLRYNGGSETVAHWSVRKPTNFKRAKNLLLFIGDGMTQPMITAARLIAHKSINGKYQTLMQLDQMEALGHQMTHSIDSFITDSANSATALYSGKKSSVNALNVWADSSSDPFDDPKFETIAELFRRVRKGPIGMVSTAVIADATPAALCSHTRSRDEAAKIVQEYIRGFSAINATLPWPTGCEGPDVVLGGGAEIFIGTATNPDVYKQYQEQGYNVVYNAKELQAVPHEKKVLGIFTKSNMAKWLDRHVYPENLKNQKNYPTGDNSDALDQPGLKEMTIKAIDILQARQRKSKSGWFMMSEAASIDKMMHALDYDRALGELLELDDTVRATLQHLEKIGELDDTLVIVTADHGHGFDVFGGVDTKYLAAQSGDRKKRAAVGVYANSGLSGYTVENGVNPSNNTIVVGSDGPNFPVTWDPRYAYAAGTAAAPDHREGYTVKKNGPRTPAARGEDGGNVVNPTDQQAGFQVSGALPVDQSQGVHSLQDVSVFASGPGSEAFRGVYNSIDIFFKMFDALRLDDK